ncbi:MAG: hypothetical protein IPK19_11460 [Chloroflexi bacterium]|nr:hypothetical protein [Chloroflexota bacterium]
MADHPAGVRLPGELRRQLGVAVTLNADLVLPRQPLVQRAGVGLGRDPAGEVGGEAGQRLPHRVRFRQASARRVALLPRRDFQHQHTRQD